MSLGRYLISKRVGNEQLVRQVDRKRHRELQLAALTGLALACAVLAYGWQHFEMIRVGYRVEELRLEREHLLELRRQLALERAALTSPDRVEAIARNQLGMMAPLVPQVYVIEPHGRWENGVEDALEQKPNQDGSRSPLARNPRKQ